jgi:gas vesicle protein
METLMFLAGAGFGATVGWLACALMTPEREAEAQQAKCRRDGCPLDLDNIDR